MWKLIGLMIGGDGIPRNENRGAPRMARPKSIDQIGDEVGCVLLALGVGFCLLAVGIAVAICWRVWS